MQLQFRKTYISIDEFDPVELPDFVVLTGVNGSGKSHLLEAIEKQHVIIAGMEQAHIVLFNYMTFRLESEPEFNGQQISADRESAWKYHQKQIKNNVQSLRTGLGENYESLKATCKAENKSFWSLSTDPLKQYKQQFKKLFNTPNIKQNEQAQGIYSLAKTIPYNFDEIQHDDFIRIYQPFVFHNNFLPNQLV